ncbi:NAD-dependent succinate-semialdehyde dehydrogenase [Quadrisphaera oryzae]|uniref:NAD-dependent succinate-semialdehyde dehydrogenase n=1 Tax=Quadrisphaera TaxID=317661 RepID=UPI0016481CCF|nr:NAD-dependent succinate-semialdehyde dehydrogenase [Quadrisphaera sp. RL12-1S]MBC3763724.1 NAD-dependent succinate-semialdehyde dehydrogenase [Quadrisphaera sp. RL12-1S]
MSDYAVVDPSTGETLRTYPTATDAEMSATLQRADAAQQAWARTSVHERAAAVRAVAALHRQRRQELAEIIQREMGKPLDQGLGEVDFCADIYEYYADRAADFLADEPIQLLGGTGSALVRKAPLGVVLGVMPWNYPYYQVARFAGPSLLIGNAVILKHAPQCPESSAAISDIMTEAGVPAGVYENVYASYEQIEKAIADPRIQGVSLTGSARAGAEIARIAGQNLKKVVLELGGSDPFIVLSTDDLAATVEAAVTARLENSGQACNAAKRFIVVEDLYEEFLERFTAALAAITPQTPSPSGVSLGPLSSSAAADRLQDQIERAVAQGATLVHGGRREGNVFTTTVLTDVTPENEAYREEFFGPVGVVYRVADEAAAVHLANDTPFGLGSYVFTTDPEQAERVADAIRAGMVFINIVAADSPELPFGGTKGSGSGRELGRSGIEEFINRKLIRTAG